MAELSARLSELSEAVADLSARQEEVVVARRLAEDGLARADYSLQVANDMSLPTRMLAFMAWLDLHPPQGDGPAISVVLATRDRPQLLRRAIASVIGQRYGNWELLVVDDGSDPGTRAAVEEFEDERMCLLEGPQSGLSAARNRGLDSAGGEIVCYLDDDNVMHPA
ncbi:MAG TPA: glycosyltransferase family A protein, partial [Solirubrobacterales bacterium]|nr:glycosyltransferase family A protein [Solirubrobacterales bacterium]